jgi:Uma2 family endonuclease
MMVPTAPMRSLGHARAIHDPEESVSMRMANTMRRWTLEELYRLPDDGNKYELVRGELFVTPPPTDAHETISARLTRLLEPYVSANGLGLIYHPRAVVRIGSDTEVEPDLMVRQPQDVPNATWEGAPLPILIVEVASDSTRRRDRVYKRDVYIDAGIAEYWIVEGQTREICVVWPEHDDVIARDTLTWHPAGAATPLVIALADVFGPPGTRSG